MIIRRETLKAVLPATSKDDSRLFTQSILIEPDGLIVATNGHVLLTAKDRSPFDPADFPSGRGVNTNSPEKAVLIEGTAAERLIAATPKKTTIPILAAVRVGQDEKGPFATATDLTIPATVDLQAVDGPDAPRFPDWRRVMPKAAEDRATVKVCLGVPVLEVLIKAAKAASAQRGNGPFITFEIPTAGGVCLTPISVTINGADVVVDGCIMPGRL